MKNRNRANRILAAVFILFVAATVLRLFIRGNSGIELFAFICEAALVGGIADWFAVTALFRKPLGFSWHTAIIPNNRDMIVEKVASLVENELISTDTIREKLSAINTADILLDRVSDIINSAFMEEQLSGFISNKAQELDTSNISRSIDTMIRDTLRKEDVSVEIRNLLHAAIERKNHVKWLSGLVQRALVIAKKPDTREKIYKVLVEQEKYSRENSGNAVAFFIKALMGVVSSSEHTNLRAVSGILQSELVSLLQQLGQESNPVFRKLQEKFEDSVNGLDRDQTLTAAIQTWKNGILDRIDLIETVETILSAVVQSQLERNEAAALIAGQLESYRQNLKQNGDIKRLVDEIARTMLEKIITNEHHLIGEIVGETLGAFTNERLNEFVEDKAGEDLQWIRINGSIVGAVAGALIFLFNHLLYQPYFMPFVHKLLGI